MLTSIFMLPSLPRTLTCRTQTTTLVQNPGRAFVHLCVMWGGAGFVINQWKKRKFHQERTFH